MSLVINQDISYVSSNDFATDYTLINKIRDGSFSEVWVCKTRNDEKQLAAKILKKDYEKTVNANILNDIFEVKVARMLGKHPFLLLVEGVYHVQKSGKIVLFTELMRKSLHDVIQQDELPFSAGRIKMYAYQMLQGLNYLHKQNFIHRDIKPENILLSWRDNVVKIADFGTAYYVAEGLPLGECVATRWYSSPECLLTRGWYGKKMDIWAMGCVICEMVTGKPLFNGRDENDQLNKIDWVLGHPDSQLIDKFKKYKSPVFSQRYESSINKTPFKRRISDGAGLHTVYHPYQPAYDVLKEMIVYDPGKRYSADRLLRKHYFNDMKTSLFEYQLALFEDSQSSKRSIFSAEPDNYIPWSFLQHNESSSTNKKQGPEGDLVPRIQKNTIQNEKVNRWVDLAANTKKPTPVKIIKSFSIRPPFK